MKGVKKRSYLWLSLLLIHGVVTLQGQRSEIRFHHLGVDDGLSHSLLNSVDEDSLGFLWFGTQDGLNRFDGYEFRSYYKGVSPRTPSDSWIKGMYMDSHNQLWIWYNGSGLERYDPVSETFRRYKADPDKPGALSSDISASDNIIYDDFCEDSEGDLWIGTEHGLNRYHREEDTFEVFLHDPGQTGTLSHNQINSITEDSKGSLWIGTPEGLNRMDRRTGEVQRFLEHPGSDTHLNSHIITKIFCHPDGSLWVGTTRGGLNIIQDPYAETLQVTHLITTPLNPHLEPTVYCMIRTSGGMMLAGTENGLYVIEAEGKGYRERLIPESRGIRITSLLEDSRGYIWFGSSHLSENNLFLLSPDLQQVEAFFYEEPDPYIFEGGRVQFLHESRTGLVWIGTEKNGLYWVDLNARQFRTIDNYPERGYYISDNEVYSIFEDKEQNLYVGTKKELNLINLRTGEWYGFNNQYNLKRNITYEYDSDLAAGVISVIREQPDGSIWMGSFDYKVSLYDPERERFLNFHYHPGDSASFLPWSLRSICVTRDRQVYFAAMGYALCRLREDGLSFEYFPVVETGDPTGTNDDMIQYVYEDRGGILWLGTLKGGLNRFDPNTGRFMHYISDPDDPASLSNNRVKCILEPEIYGEDILWIGTQNGGLNKFDRSTGTFRSFVMQDGLPSNTIHGILEDKVGNLWLSTNQGLVQFDPVTEIVSNIFTVEDGLVGNEFNEGAFFKNRDGIMYFGGTNGLNYFNPEEIKQKSTYSAPVVITGFSLSGTPVLPNDTINDRVVLERSILFTDEITLTHKDRFISFTFAKLDFSAPKKVKYRFRLDGFEEQWNEVDASQRYISYTNLPSGNYRLLLAGTNSDGILSDETVLTLNILPPFWQTTWFRLLIGLVILMIFLLILQVRTQILENQKRLLIEEVEARTKDLKEANRLLERQKDEIQGMAQKLHESDQMKLKFFTNISHEFRTPLTLIMGPTEKLLSRERYDDVHSVKQELELMHRNQRRLYKLINQLLEVRRVEAGNLKLTVAEDDIAAYLETIYRLFMPYAEKKQIEFRFESLPSSLRMLFDADKIEKIFYNLLSNAFKYTPVKGNILFQLDTVEEDEKEYLRVCVRDSGPGIAPEHLPHIFDRFYQITKKHHAGRFSSGIGLSLSRDLIEIHHGRIEAESGIEGTCFSVYLPLDRGIYTLDEILEESDTDPTMEYISSMLETYEYTGASHADKPLVGEVMFRILVVEDNLDMQKFLYDQLSEQYHVTLAQHGKEGLELCRETLPDLILSDIMMPEMDGLEFCRNVKEDVLTSHIPIILLTAKSGTEDQVIGLEEGADDYITKPFNPEALQLKIRNILENRKRLAEKFESSASYIPENIQISQIDQGFLEKLIKLVEDNIDDSELSGDSIATEMGMSKGNLYKKLKTLTGMTVNIFVRNIRLKVAARLLKRGHYNISEVAYAVGFNNPKYFSTCFSELYHVSPKEYMKSHQDPE
jgi:signal transduction histidine kinase/ligand-binding sensor domain-containing protein/AraC-like DNA-binding protein